MSETTTAAPTTTETPAAPAPESAGSVLGNVTSAAPVAPATPETPEAEAAAEPEKPEAPVVPEAYDFQAPEDFTIDEQSVDTLKTRAKELGLTQEQFAGMAALGIEQIKAATAGPVQAWQAMQNKWKAEIEADPDLGLVNGELAPAPSQDVARVFAEYPRTKQLAERMFENGSGNEPEMVRFVRWVGQRMNAAGPLDQGKPAPATRQGNGFNDIASRLYPSANAGA
jgi:hypothetical protein